MSTRIVVTGTDTGIGKTVLAAGLAGLLDGHYWKPVQAGLDEETDSETIARLGGLPPDRILPEAYRLKLPASPHFAAEAEGARIDDAALALPDMSGALVIEGAGGALVPLRRDLLFADVFARWSAPAVIAARTELGTINHTLMTIEALRSRSVPVLGIAFIGDSVPDSERTICEIGGVRRLGRLPRLDPLTKGSLAAAMAAAFDRQDFVS